VYLSTPCIYLHNVSIDDIQIYIHIYIWFCEIAQSYLSDHIHTTYIHIYISIYIYIYIHTHTHTRIHSLSLSHTHTSYPRGSTRLRATRPTSCMTLNLNYYHRTKLLLTSTRPTSLSSYTLHTSLSAYTLHCILSYFFFCKKK